MPTWAVLLIILIAVLIIAAVAWMFFQKRRSEQLREQFGPEYERTISDIGDRRRAEKELETRREHVERLHIRSLSAQEQTQFADAWRATQARFVDDPGGAIGEADRLITEVMQKRGYPMQDFEARTADISVEHPQVVDHYRTAHGIAQANEQGEASTEDLRQAMVHYRALFEDLLETKAIPRKEAV